MFKTIYRQQRRSSCWAFMLPSDNFHQSSPSSTDLALQPCSRDSLTNSLQFLIVSQSIRYRSMLSTTSIFGSIVPTTWMLIIFSGWWTAKGSCSKGCQTSHQLTIHYRPPTVLGLTWLCHLLLNYSTAHWLQAIFLPASKSIYQSCHQEGGSWRCWCPFISSDFQFASAV